MCGKEEVIDGRLVSEDGMEQYPVIEGIPRLLPKEYMPDVWSRYPQWFQKHGSIPGTPQSGSSYERISMQRRTAEQFGREWRTFDNLLGDFDEVFREYFDLIDLEGLNDKTALDGGCGMGRWAYHLAPKTHRIVAFDLSFAVEPAYRNCYDRGNVEVIQADIFHLPLRPASFGFVYCLGVLHHLPDPLAGFMSLKRLLEADGKLLTYIYYNLENRPQYFLWLKKSVDLIRRLTIRAPAAISYTAAFITAVTVYLPLIFLGSILNSLGLRDRAKNIPIYPFYSGRSFRLIFNDAVDRLTAPIENRYSRREIARWFSQTGFCRVEFSDSAPYWKTCGELCRG